MTITFVQALIAVGGLAAFLGMFYGPWQWICTDIARQFVFEKRDAIFDIATKGQLSFNSREYAVVRSALQANIRFAHELTLPHFIVLGIAHWLRGDLKGRVSLDYTLEQIADPIARDRAQKLVSEAYLALFFMMLAKSIWILILFPVTIVMFCVVALFRDAARMVLRAAGRVIQVEAESTASGTRPVSA